MKKEFTASIRYTCLLLVAVVLCLSSLRAQEPDAAALVASGDEKAARKDYAGAIADYTSCLAQDPGNASAFAKRSMVETKNRSLDSALADAEKAVAIAPDLSDAYLARGYVRAAKGSREAALEAYNQAILLDANSAVAHVYRVW